MHHPRSKFCFCIREDNPFSRESYKLLTYMFVLVVMCVISLSLGGKIDIIYFLMNNVLKTFLKTNLLVSVAYPPYWTSRLLQDICSYCWSYQEQKKNNHHLFLFFVLLSQNLIIDSYYFVKIMYYIYYCRCFKKPRNVVTFNVNLASSWILMGHIV